MKTRFAAYFITLGSFIFNHLVAQLESSNWHFGPTSKGLYFSPAGVPSVTNISYTPYGAEGCSVLSDPITGALRFYTDGSRVVDDGHAVMPNGSGLFGLSSAEGSGKIARDPANCNRYYIFHNTSVFETGSSTKKCYYSIVDVTLPGNGTVAIPKGDVVPGFKNILFASSVAEGMEIVPETNTHSFWLLLTSNSPSAIIVYKFTPGSITLAGTTPLITTLQDIRPVTYCKVNNKLAVGSMNDYNETLMMDFNPATGSITSQFIIPGLPAGTNGNYYGIYSLAWSQDGTNLYISKYRQGTTGGKLYQYSLATTAVTLIYNVHPSSISYSAKGLKMGPDGKIYFLYTNSSGSVIDIGAINSPNNAGLACAFNPAAINMGTNLGIAHKFPDFLYSNNSIRNINDTSITLIKPCNSSVDTTYININNPSADVDSDLLSYQVISNNFPTASITVIGSSAIQYINTTPPPYTDTLIIRYCDNYCLSECRTFKVILNITSAGTAVLSLPASFSTCAGTAQIIDAGTGFYNYNWSTGDTTQIISITNTGVYNVTAEDSVGCIYSGSTNITFNPLPVVQLGNDTTACSTFILNAGTFPVTIWSNGVFSQADTISSSGLYYVNVIDNNGCEASDTINIIINVAPAIEIGGPYYFCDNTPIAQTLYTSGAPNTTWSTGSNNDSIVVNLPGTYFASALSSAGCYSYDTTQILILPAPISNLPAEYSGCPKNFNAGGGAAYLWSTAETTSSIYILSSGAYSVLITSSNGCSSSYSVSAVIDNFNHDYLSQIPNIFTPNGDSQNDNFKIGFIFNNCTRFKSIAVYNRWGQKVYESEDPAFEWDGNYNGKNLSDGVYYGIIESEESENTKRDAIFISIIR